MLLQRKHSFGWWRCRLLLLLRAEKQSHLNHVDSVGLQEVKQNCQNMNALLIQFELKNSQTTEQRNTIAALPQNIAQMFCQFLFERWFRCAARPSYRARFPFAHQFIPAIKDLLPAAIECVWTIDFSANRPWQLFPICKSNLGNIPDPTDASKSSSLLWIDYVFNMFRSIPSAFNCNWLFCS